MSTDPAPLDRFSALVAHDESEIDLARACLQIAEDAYPGLDVDGYLGEIERFAGRLGARLAPTATVEDRVIALNEFLFADLGFRGNTEDYYDPRNSYLNEVIDRRRGIPLTLSVLYMEIGRRIELRVVEPAAWRARSSVPAAHRADDRCHRRSGGRRELRHGRRVGRRPRVRRIVRRVRHDELRSDHRPRPRSF